MAKKDRELEVICEYTEKEESVENLIKKNLCVFIDRELQKDSENLTIAL